MKKTGIIVLIIILTLLAISLTKVLIFAINNNNWNWFSSFGSAKELRKEEYIRKEESIELGSAKNLELEFESSDLNVFFTEDSKIRVVQYSYQELEEDQLFIVEQSSSDITITENHKPRFYLFYINQTAYDVYLPREYEGSLQIKAVSGDIEVNENLKFNELAISSTSGDIKMGNIEAKEVQIETISGEIKLQNLNIDTVKLKTISGDISVESVIGKMEAKTTSGDIKVQKIEGNMEIETTSGDILCQDVKVIEDSKIKTTSGDVKTYLNKESNCKIQTKTVSGDVTFPNGINVMGEEPYVELDVETVSGDIRLEEEQ